MSDKSNLSRRSILQLTGAAGVAGLAAGVGATVTATETADDDGTDTYIQFTNYAAEPIEGYQYAAYMTDENGDRQVVEELPEEPNPDRAPIVGYPDVDVRKGPEFGVMLVPEDGPDSESILWARRYISEHYLEQPWNGSATCSFDDRVSPAFIDVSDWWSEFDHAPTLTLGTPTAPDVADTSGIWFMDPETGEPGLEHLDPDDELPDGWTFEAWAVIDGTPVSIGRFDDPTTADRSGNPFSGPDAAPDLPGEDFVQNAPEGLEFPVDLTEADTTVLISLELDVEGRPFGDGPSPFKLFEGEITADATPTTPIELNGYGTSSPRVSGSDGVMPEMSWRVNVEPLTDGCTFGYRRDDQLRINRHKISVGSRDPDENFVPLTNTTLTPIDMTGHTLTDRYGDLEYEFPDGYVFRGNTTLKLISGEGDDESGLNEDKLYLGFDEAVWDRNADTVNIFDENGEQVFQENYQRSFPPR